MIAMLFSFLWPIIVVVTVVLTAFVVATWLCKITSGRHPAKHQTLHVSSIRPPTTRPKVLVVFNEDHPDWPHYRDNYKTRH